MEDIGELDHSAPQNMPDLEVAVESFRRLFAQIGLTDPVPVDEYVEQLKEQRVYNVRLMLRRLSGLESLGEVTAVLVRLKIRTLHARDLSELLFGGYNEVEERLIDRRVLCPVHFSGNWSDLLISLDIEPAQEIAPQLFHATNASLETMLIEVHRAMDMKACFLQDILNRVPIFQQTPHLIEVLDAALTRAIATLPSPPTPTVRYE